MTLDSNTSILIVDDMPTIRKVLINIIRPMGFTRFYEAKDGIEAMDILNVHHPIISLIIADWNMPRMSGMDLWRDIKKKPEYKHINFIMITSENERNNILLALKEGVTDYVLKPFEPKLIKERIQKL